MKIAIITSRYPSKNNPYNHMFVHMRAIEMIKKGYSVTIHVPSSERNTYIHETVKVEKCSSIEIIKKISDYNVTYLHLLNIYPFSRTNGWPIYKFIMRNDIPFAMYVHGNEVQKYGARMFEFNFRFTDLLKWIKKDLFVIPKMKRFVNNTKQKKNAAFLFPSNWMREDMEQNLNVKLDQFTIIPNGIDTKLFKFYSLFNNRFKLLTLRPLSSKKYAVDIAIEIMRYLPDAFTLDIYGKGEYKNEYLTLIKNYNLDNRVSIKESFIERNNLSTFFSKYGVFLSPTRMDAQGVSMCEAMSSGLLTVSNENTAIPEFIIDNENGILDNDPKTIAEKIVRVIQKEEKYKQTVNSGRISMEEISIEKTVEKELNTLKGLNS